MAEVSEVSRPEGQSVAGEGKGVNGPVVHDLLGGLV